MSSLPPEPLDYILSHAAESPIALIGSANLVAQGIDIPWADLDFLTDDDGVRAFAQLLDGDPTKEHGYLEFWSEYQGVVVNFTSYQGNTLRKPLPEEKLTYVSLGEIPLPCVPLESELSFYETVARNEKDARKAALIRTVIQV